MSNWVERIERIRGKGRLRAGHIYSVGYMIDLFQKYSESTPTQRFARGHLTGMRAGDIAHAIWGPRKIWKSPPIVNGPPRKRLINPADRYADCRQCERVCRLFTSNNL